MIDVYRPKDTQASRIIQTICNADFKRKHSHYSEKLNLSEVWVIFAAELYM